MSDTEDEVRDALARHGYNPDLEPRGIGGGPGEFDGLRREDAGNFVSVKLRNWVCQLDGIIIDGHIDPDQTGTCIECGADYFFEDPS